MHCSSLSPTFSSVLLYDHPFSRYCTFYDFFIDSHVKISKCHKIFNFGYIAKTSITLCPIMTALFIIRFGSDRMKTGGVAFEIFAPIASHANEKEKTNFKIWKVEILKKRKKAVWRYGAWVASHKIWLGSVQRFFFFFEKPELTDGRTTDACATSVALLASQAELKKVIWKYREYTWSSPHNLA